MNYQGRKLKLIHILLFTILAASIVFPTRQTRAQSSGPIQIYLPMISQSGNQTSDLCSPGGLQWLCLLNQYRTAAGLNIVSHNPDFSSALALHTNYLLLNPEQENFHTEDPENPGYTDEGKNAGLASNMAKKESTNFQVVETMDLWMMFASHRYNMLHPDLLLSGFDLSCDNLNCASGLNVLGSLPPSYQVSEVNVIYPGENQADIPADIFPVTWGFYMPWTSVVDDGDEVDMISAEIYDQQNQKISITRSEPDHNDGSWDYKNQVVLIPNQALLSNHTYRVEMTVQWHDQTYQRSWTFTTR